jgi:hypothetical protein
MQHRYVGDVGDFGKYALLRALCQPEPAINLAVIWCLFPDESGNNDGRHVSYLRDQGFAQLDASLHAALADIVTRSRRNIAAIGDSGCLPTSTVFCADPISALDAAHAGSAERLRYRGEWLETCLRRTTTCQLVFFDPDNGLEIASIPKYHPKAGKYIYWDELAQFWRRGNTLLIYHHVNRTITAAKQVTGLTERIAVEFPDARIIPLVFRRGSARVFWLIHRADDLGLALERRAANMLGSGWSRHFRPFGWPDEDSVAPSGLPVCHPTGADAKGVNDAADAGFDLLNESRRLCC